ncbi:hypothetical protein [Lacipirellula parvula]|uniref:Uncharacterized protein n=1 Tax=Lacipirellula parvula TaxID=2650471 RepID=A0A5K7XB82_9BACT|nr:hypothetical protein [Lacipirellula parvula]BBO32091.1 hypothetical protein PLANPX_1703 [Lacipirellula parvula]
MRTKGLRLALLMAVCLQAAGSSLAHTPPSRKPSKRKEKQNVTVALATAWSAANLER